MEAHGTEKLKLNGISVNIDLKQAISACSIEHRFFK